MTNVEIYWDYAVVGSRWQGLVVGTARCAVLVAERSVRRRKNGRFTTFVPSCRTGTPQRGVPTRANFRQRHNPENISPFFRTLLKITKGAIRIGGLKCSSR